MEFLAVLGIPILAFLLWMFCGIPLVSTLQLIKADDSTVDKALGILWMICLLLSFIAIIPVALTSLSLGD